ncbi:MAG: OmpH family outer membrane protein, partial [Schwartzia sp.]|nr:OmpH family outer membrane protein [Schwartzia sp. (in: firmicutes)]
AKEDEFNQKVQANPPTSQEEADRIQAEANELGQTLQQEAEADMNKLQEEAATEAQRIRQEAGIQMQGLQTQYQTRIRQKLDNAVDEVARAKKLDVVLDNSIMQKSVIYGGVDITEDLLEKLK